MAKNFSLGISHNFQGEVDFIVMVIRKTTAPLADVICVIDGVSVPTGRKSYPAPHSQISALIEGLDPVWYTIKFYRSSDGTALDEELLTLAGNAAKGETFAVIRYDYVVGREDSGSELDEVWADPMPGDHGIRDERLLDKTFWVEERGTGTMLPAEITVKNDEGGGWDWSNPDKNFEDGGVYFAFVVDTLTTNENSNVVLSADFNEVVQMTADMDYDAGTMTGKVIVSNVSALVATLALGDPGTLPDSKFRLNTHYGVGRNTIIKLDPGFTVRFLRQDYNSIILGQGEEIEVLITNGVVYITMYAGDYRKVGQRIWGDHAVELNVLKLDGTQYAQTDVPRLVQWINNGSVPTVSEATWATSVDLGSGELVYPNKGKFAFEGSTVRVPDMRNKMIRSLLYLDGTSDGERLAQGAGGFQGFKTSMKRVNVGLRDGNGGNATGQLSGTGFSGQDNYANWITEDGSGQSHIRFNAGADGFTGTDESRPDNIGMFPLLKI